MGDGKQVKNKSGIGKEAVRKSKPVGADGHRARMLERFEKSGADGMDDRQLLEILLFYALPRVDTRDQSVRLIETFGSLDGVLNASRDELTGINGIGPRAAALLKLVNQISLLRMTPAISRSKSYPSEEDIGALFVGSISNISEERVMLAAFDGKKRLITLYKSPSGSHGSCSISIRTITDFIAQTRASYLAVAHNHPNGDLIASVEDREFTAILEKLIPKLDAGFLGHYIVNSGDFIKIWV